MLQLVWEQIHDRSGLVILSTVGQLDTPARKVRCRIYALAFPTLDSPLNWTRGLVDHRVARPIQCGRNQKMLSSLALQCIDHVRRL